MPDNKSPITPHFTIEQAKEMVESGLVSIQPHTYNLHWTKGQYKSSENGVNRREGEALIGYRIGFLIDFLKIKNLIEFDIGEEVVAFSYPNGIFNGTTESILQQQGIKFSFSTMTGINKIDAPTYLMRRFNISNDVAIDMLEAQYEC